MTTPITIMVVGPEHSRLRDRISSDARNENDDRSGCHAGKNGCRTHAVPSDPNSVRRFEALVRLWYCRNVMALIPASFRTCALRPRHMIAIVFRLDCTTGICGLHTTMLGSILACTSTNKKKGRSSSCLREPRLPVAERTKSSD